MKPRRFAISLDVRGCIDSLRNQRNGPTMLQTPEGRNLTSTEAITVLTIELAKGHARIPMSKECGNPCPHAADGCEGFDFKKSGCPGYEIDR